MSNEKYRGNSAVTVSTEIGSARTTPHRALRTAARAGGRARRAFPALKRTHWAVAGAQRHALHMPANISPGQRDRRRGVDEQRCRIIHPSGPSE